MGVAFKAETDDTRDSLAIQILNKLNKMKLKIIYTDEYYIDKKIYKLDSFIKKSDLIIIGAPHKKYKKIKFPKNKKYIDVWGII